MDRMCNEALKDVKTEPAEPEIGTQMNSRCRRKHRRAAKREEAEKLNESPTTTEMVKVEPTDATMSPPEPTLDIHTVMANQPSLLTNSISNKEIANFLRSQAYEYLSFADKLERNTLDAVARKKIAAELRSITNQHDPMDITPSGDAAMKEVETVEPRPQGAVKATRLNIGRSASEPLPKVPRLHGEYVVVNLETDSSSPVNAESLIVALERIGISGIEQARIRPLQGRTTGMTGSPNRFYATFETSDADLLRKLDEHCWTHVPVGNSQWIARYDSAVEYLLQLFVRRVQEKLPEHERIPLPDKKLADSAFLERLLVRHEAAATAVYKECTRALKWAIRKTAKNVGIDLPF